MTNTESSTSGNVPYITFNRSLKDTDSTIVTTEAAARNSTEMVGSDDENAASTKKIIDSLVDVFPAGMAEGAVVNRLMTAFHIDRDTAKACYKSALEKVSKMNNVSQTEIQQNAQALVSGEDLKKADGMSNLNAWSDYQKTLLEASGGGDTSTSGGD